MLIKARRGMAWLALLAASAPALAQPGVVESHAKFVRTAAEFPDPPFGDVTSFGSALASLGDLDGSGPAALALAIGSHRDHLGIQGPEPGNVFIAFLDSSGQLMAGLSKQIRNPEGAADGDRFGIAVASIGDLDGDGVTDLAVGAPADAGEAVDTGDVYVIFMSPDGSPKDDPDDPGNPLLHKIDASAGGDMAGLLQLGDVFGTAVAGLGAWNGPCGNLTAIAVSEHNDDDGGTNTGSVWILWLNADGSVACLQKINEANGGFGGTLADNDRFGFALASLDDLDGDGVTDVGVGVPYDDHDTGNPDAQRGALWILFLNGDGTVKDETKFTPQLVNNNRFFGASLASLGDLDGGGPGVVTLAVGMPGVFGGVNTIWLLNLDAGGNVLDQFEIAEGQGGFEVDVFSGFGTSLAALGDLDGDGTMDFAAADPGDPGKVPGDTITGAVYTLFLRGAVSFDPPQEFTAAGSASVHDTGDLDNDGDVDVVAVLPGMNAVQIFLNLGNDMQGAWLGLDEMGEVIPVGLDPSGLVIALVDGDGFLDVAVSNQGDDTVSLLINDGDGTFTPAPPLGAPLVPGAPSAIDAGDFDQFGGVDLAVSSALLDQVWTVLNDGNANFAQGAAVNVGLLPVEVDPADVDNDKDTDMVAANSGSDDISVLVNLGAGIFQDAINVPVGDMPVDLAIGDFDGNGLIDLASADNGSAQVSIVLNQGGGVYDPSFPVAVGDLPVSVDAVDLDGGQDGNALPDLVVVAEDPEAGAVIQILENLGVPGPSPGGGQPVFGVPLSIDVQAEPNFVLHADFDNNGFADVVTVNTDDGDTNGSVTVLLNDPACAGDTDFNDEVGFDDLIALLAAWGPNPGHPTDLDGDGIVGFNDLLILLSGWGACP